jgi:putative Mg2+ transporter-C (MgtC) family protein
MLQDLDVYSLSDQLVLLARCGAAAVCGGVVGLERELAGKQAGIRTHTLVAAASSLAVGVGDLAVVNLGAGDPTRVLHAVVTGVGFIGAGAIIHSKSGLSPSGLTTATTIFMVAVLGAACGMGAPALALAVTGLTMATLRGVSVLERWAGRLFRSRRRRAGYTPDADLSDDESGT